ncbi:glutathione S-transferase omega-1-like [Denticeps clupeoides]|nr:glutathione S-transferase omega-1 [Denticeps clupeoides]
MASQKSLGKGSCAPGPVPKDTIRLYSMRFCPFAQRARLVLHSKGIKHEIINVNLKDKPDWFLEKNPFGTVPVLETSGSQIIYESPITCDYLDEAFPQKKLLPSDPFEKAQQKMLLELYSKIIPYMYKIPASRENGENVSALEAEFKDKLSDLNEKLASKKTKFFGGDTISMIDYMIWPWFERLGMVELEHCITHCPDLKKWIVNMLDDPTVKALLFSTEDHKFFFKSYVSGKPNYDFGL